MIFKAEIWGGKKENVLETAVRSKEDTYLTSFPVWEKKQPLLGGTEETHRSSGESQTSGGARIGVLLREATGTGDFVAAQ